jgi:hypothetical protein
MGSRSGLLRHLGLLEAIVSYQIPQISRNNSHTETKKSTIASIWSACPSLIPPPPWNPSQAATLAPLHSSINSAPCKAAHTLQWSKSSSPGGLWVGRSERASSSSSHACLSKGRLLRVPWHSVHLPCRSCRKFINSVVFLEVGILPMELCRPPFVKPAWHK